MLLRTSVPLLFLMGCLVLAEGAATELPCGGGTDGLEVSDAELELMDCDDFSRYLELRHTVARLTIKNSRITNEIFFAIGDTHALEVVVNDTTFAPDAFVRVERSVLDGASLRFTNITIEGPMSSSTFRFGPPGATDPGTIRDTTISIDGLRYTQGTAPALMLRSTFRSSTLRLVNWLAAPAASVSAASAVAFTPQEMIGLTTLEVLNSQFSFYGGTGTMMTVQRPAPYSNTVPVSLDVRCVALPLGGTVAAAAPGTPPVASCSMADVTINGTESISLGDGTVCSTTTFPVTTACVMPGDKVEPTRGAPPQRRTHDSLIGAWFEEL